MAQEKLIQLVLEKSNTFDLFGLAKEFEGKHEAAYKRVIVELSRRPGALTALKNLKFA